MILPRRDSSNDASPDTTKKLTPQEKHELRLRQIAEKKLLIHMAPKTIPFSAISDEFPPDRPQHYNPIIPTD